MRINSVNSQPQNRQSFGAMLPIAREVQDYLKTDVFKSCPAKFDEFEKYVAGITINQMGNPLYDIGVVRAQVGGKDLPQVQIISKGNGPFIILSPNRGEYKEMDLPSAVNQMMVDADDRAIELLGSNPLTI